MIVLGSAVLGISLLLQLIAAYLAWRLIRVTKRHLAWILMVMAFFLMEIRRCIPLFRIILKGGSPPPDLVAELVALITSALLVAGIAWIAPFFLSIKRSEEKMRETWEWLFTTLKSIGDAVITTDTRGCITFMNPTAQALIGQKEKEAIGKPLKNIFTIIDGETGEPREDPVTRAISRNMVVGLDASTLLVTKKGVRLAIDDSAAPIKNEKGDIIGAVLVFRDISERQKAKEEIKLAHSELNQIFNTAADGMRVIDTDFHIIRINERFSDLLGLSRDEIIGGKCYEIFPGSTCHTQDCSMRRILDGENYLEYDVEKELQNGLKISCIMTAAPLRRPDGTLIGIVENFKDITERKRTEELLHRAKMLVENSPTVFFRWEVKEDWTVEFVSENVNQFGYQAEELLSGEVPFISIIHPDDHDRLTEQIKQYTDLGKTQFQQEYRLVTRDGQTRWVDARIMAEFGPDKQIAFYQGIIIDITERKQAEEALKLRKDQERLSIILDGNPIPTFVIDSDHHLILWNRACESLTGVSKEQALGKPVDSGIFYQGRIRPVLADFVLDADEKAMLNLYGDKNLSQNPSIPEAFEAQDLLTIRGVQKNVSFLAARIRDTEGNVIGAIETIHDVTEREQLYRQLLHSQKMEAIGRLAGGVAHDFNNLLVIIRGYSEFLLSRLDEQAPMRKEIEVIKATGDRAASLTRQLLAFSRKQMLHPKVLDLNKLVVDMEKMLRRLISEDIELATDLGPDLERVKADPGQIEQVIMNLVINARDAMPGGGKVTIKTENVELNQESCHLISHEKSGRFVCLSVTDTGIGMDKKLIDKIFEPFFSTKGPAKGTGLGLSTVYGIIEQHGGCVNIQSEPEKGSTFWIYLPALAVEVEHEPAEAASFPKYQGNGERILLIEDEKEVRTFVTKMLHESGYEVFQAVDAEEAIHIFDKENGNFHLIFSDVVLPGKNGLELVEQLLSRQSRIKILLTSGYADDKSQWPLIRERNYCFLKKPYDLGSLLRNVREALDSSHRPTTMSPPVRTTREEE